MAPCPNCGASSDGFDIDPETTALVCTSCGTVVQESQVVTDELSFGKNAAGNAVLHGTNIRAGQSSAFGSGRYRCGGTMESREEASREAKRLIERIAHGVGCAIVADRAHRWYTLAVTYNFNKGRRTQHVAAACLYIACRQEKCTTMLIDLADYLKMNVFDLGHHYLKLINLLNLRMDIIDPAIFVNRFAKHLEFGDEVGKVTKDAVRLCQRMNRDWMTDGRRPSGICGAALLIAARMNNFRRSIKEIVLLAKVADCTIYARLEEFQALDSAALTVTEFRSVRLEAQHDPPSFGPKKSKKRKRVQDEEQNKAASSTPAEQDDAGNVPPPKRLRVDADGFAIPDIPIDPALFASGDPGPSNPTPNQRDSSPPQTSTPQPESIDESEPHDGQDKEHYEEELEKFLEEEIRAIIDEPNNTEIVIALTEEQNRAVAKQRAKFASIPDDAENLDDVDDDPEIACVLMTEEESNKKERIWTENNKDWLKDQEYKRLKRETDARNGIVKKIRKRQGKKKPRDSNSEDMAATPAESAMRMLKQRKFSKKIDYKVMEALFNE